MITHNSNKNKRHRYEVPRLSYEDIKQIMERRLAQQKRGILTENEINHIVKDWGDQRAEEELDKTAIKREVRRLERKFKRYNVAELGSMPSEKEEGRCRMLYCQLNNASTKEVREVKMSAVTHLNTKYDIDVDMFAEIGHNWGVGGRGHNLGSWLDSREKIRFKSAHNNEDPNTSSYQPGGTGIIVRGRMTQYAKHGEQDNRKLGRYCSYVFWANASHKCRVVVAYNICNGKPEGLRTQYQQLKRYCQNKNINTGPK